MIRKKFFEDPSSIYASKVQKNFNCMWRRLLAFEKKSGLSVDTPLTKEQYVDLFNSMRIRHTTTFFNYKSFLMAYIRYLIENGALPPEQENILSAVTVDDLKIDRSNGVQYYKNLSMLHKAIQDSISVSECYDPTLYDLAAVVLYLAWYGLSEEEIIDYQKEYVSDDGILIKGKKIEPPFEVLQVFTRLRDADGYYQQAKGIIFHTYAFSDHLIRTERNAVITITMLQGLLNRLNALMDGEYSLKYRVVYQSGIFYRAYLLECESSTFNLDDPDFASNVFCEDLSGKAKRTARIRDYKLYKQLFY